jgi:hypothetical protein
MMCQFAADSGQINATLSTTYISSHYKFTKYIRRGCLFRYFSYVPKETINQQYVRLYFKMPSFLKGEQRKK